MSVAGTMICNIAARNMRVLNKAVESLSRISTEVYMECFADEWVLSAMGKESTYYAKFSFKKAFFVDYHLTNDDGQPPLPPDASLACKLYVHCLRIIFKPRIERKIESCKIQLDGTLDHIIFRVKYNSKEVLYHMYRLIAWTRLSLAYETVAACNHLVASNRLFASVLRTFQAANEKVYMETSSECIRLRNYLPNDGPFRGVRLQVRVQWGEFSDYNAPQDVRIIFALKPFKAFYTYADALKLRMKLCFGEGGSPLIVTTHQPNYQGLAVISTAGSSVSPTFPAPPPPNRHLQPRNAHTDPDESQDSQTTTTSSDFRGLDLVVHCGASSSSSSASDRIHARKMRRIRDEQENQAPCVAPDELQKRLMTTEEFGACTSGLSRIDLEQSTSRLVERDESARKRLRATEDSGVCTATAEQSKVNEKIAKVFKYCFDATLASPPRPKGTVIVPNSDSDTDEDSD